MKGIMFKPDSIGAIVEGRKTQTRRVTKFRSPRNPTSSLSGHGGIYSMGDTARELEALQKGIIKPDLSLSRYQVGETVYIKEKLWRIGEGAIYYSDSRPVMFYRSLNRLHWRWQKDWLSPLHCPEEAARHFITITDVSAERLQEITDADAIAEGIIVEQGRYIVVYRPFENGASYATPRDAYFILWNSINKDCPWESNPWVFAYTFSLKEAK